MHLKWCEAIISYTLTHKLNWHFQALLTVLSNTSWWTHSCCIKCHSRNDCGASNTLNQSKVSMLTTSLMHKSTDWKVNSNSVFWVVWHSTFMQFCLFECEGWLLTLIKDSILLITGYKLISQACYITFSYYLAHHSHSNKNNKPFNIFFT